MKIYLSKKRPKEVSSARFISHECASCNNQFTTNASLDFPACPCCGKVGSFPLDSSHKEEMPLITDETTLNCGKCKNVLIVEASTTMSSLHCPECSTELSFYGKPPTGTIELPSSRKATSRNPNYILPLNKTVDAPYRFEAHDNKIVAFKDFVPVATAEIDDYAPGYINALNEQCVSNPKFELPNDFTLFEIILPEETLHKELLDEQRNALDSEYKDKLNHLGERFKQSLSLALSGSTRNLVENTISLQGVVYQSLIDSGINDMQVIDNVLENLESNLDLLTSSINEQAMLLVDKTDEERNELASLMITSNDSPIKTEIASQLTKSLTPKKIETSSTSSNGKVSIVKSLAKASPIFGV